MDFDSPDVAKDFPGLARALSDAIEYDDWEKSKKKKEKKDSKKDKERGYATLADSPDESAGGESKSPGKGIKIKSFKLTSSKKKEKDKDKEKKESIKPYEKEHRKSFPLEKEKKVSEDEKMSSVEKPKVVALATTTTEVPQRKPFDGQGYKNSPVVVEVKSSKKIKAVASSSNNASGNNGIAVGTTEKAAEKKGLNVFLNAPVPLLLKKKDKEKEKDNKKEPGTKVKLRLKRGSKSSLEDTPFGSETSPSQAHPHLPEDPEIIGKEIRKYETMLEQTHAQVKSGKKVSKKIEEQLWELQRTLTQLKRKLRSVNSLSASIANPPSTVVNKGTLTFSTSATKSLSSEPHNMVANPPIKVLNLPVQGLNPPIQVLNPPIQVLNPSIQVLNQPIQVLNHPIQVLNPPIQVLNPPIQVLNPPMTNSPIQVMNPPIQVFNLPAPPTPPPLSMSGVTAAEVISPVEVSVELDCTTPSPPNAEPTTVVPENIAVTVKPVESIPTTLAAEGDTAKATVDSLSQNEVPDVEVEVHETMQVQVEIHSATMNASQENPTPDDMFAQEIQSFDSEQTGVIAPHAKRQNVNILEKGKHLLHIEESPESSKSKSEEPSTTGGEESVERELSDHRISEVDPDEGDYVFLKANPTHRFQPQHSEESSQCSSTKRVIMAPSIFDPFALLEFKTDEFIAAENEALILFNQQLQDEIVKEEEEIELLIQRIQEIAASRNDEMEKSDLKLLEDDELVNVWQIIKFENDTLNEQVLNLKTMVANSRLEEFRLETRVKYLQDKNHSRVPVSEAENVVFTSH